MPDRIEIGIRLRTLRISIPLSSDEVSVAIGVSRSAIQMYEAGKRLPKDTIKAKLASFYGLTVEELFFSPKMPQKNDLSQNVTRKEVPDAERTSRIP